MKASTLNQLAETDRTFRREGSCWVGRCIICNGPIRFESATGEGATVEHIVPRSLGGDNDLLNLGVAHARCNSEKGHRWDARRRHRQRREQYAALTERLQRERTRRFRPPSQSGRND